jgi:hypothetical protein
MYLIPKVGDRQKGMGLRITKFHAITHMSHQDILHFGVPLCFDTGPDEAMHQAARTAAKVTQKRKELFDEQVGQRMMERRTLELARAQDGSRKLWDYYFQTRQETCQRKTMLRNTDPFGPTFGFAIDDHGKRQFVLIGRGPTGLNNNSQKIVSCFVGFVNDLQDKISLRVPNTLIYTK